MIALNIGGASFHQKNWLNLDYPFGARARKMDFSKIDVKHNLMSMKPIPLADRSVDIIYSSHTIEHLTREAVQFMVIDSYRMLKDGGILRITCPDAEKLYNWYHYSPEKLRKTVRREPSAIESLVDWVATPVRRMLEIGEMKKVLEMWDMEQSLNKFELMCNVGMSEQEKKPGDHISWWTTKSLGNLMMDTGFSRIIKSKRGESVNEELRKSFIDSTAPEVSLYVEGVK